MHRTRIKICGVGQAEDALLAARLGADAVGMVFHPPARRGVSIDRAREIVAVLPPFVTPVGLFVDAELQRILDIAGELHLRHLQLHGQESPQRIAELKGFAILKAIRVERDRLEETLDFWRRAIVDHQLTNLQGLVLETAGQHVGGAGIANDWEAICDAQARGAFDGLPPVIAAGGLTPETVGAVVRKMHPWAVDVSSGVEETFGRKSDQRLRTFIKAVRESI